MLNKKHVLILGGSSDIGTEVVKNFLSKDWIVTAQLFKNKKKLQKLQKKSNNLKLIKFNFSNFQNSFKINLIEKNYKLIKLQQKNLNKLKIDDISWSDEFIFPKNKPMIIYANEFFDCLPIRQFYKKNNKFSK